MPQTKRKRNTTRRSKNQSSSSSSSSDGRNKRNNNNNPGSERPNKKQKHRSSWQTYQKISKRKADERKQVAKKQFGILNHRDLKNGLELFDVPLSSDSMYEAFKYLIKEGDYDPSSNENPMQILCKLPPGIVISSNLNTFGMINPEGKIKTEFPKSQYYFKIAFGVLVKPTKEDDIISDDDELDDNLKLIFTPICPKYISDRWINSNLCHVDKETGKRVPLDQENSEFATTVSNTITDIFEDLLDDNKVQPSASTSSRETAKSQYRLAVLEKKIKEPSDDDEKEDFEQEWIDNYTLENFTSVKGAHSPIDTEVYPDLIVKTLTSARINNYAQDNKELFKPEETDDSILKKRNLKCKEIFEEAKLDYEESPDKYKLFCLEFNAKCFSPPKNLQTQTNENRDKIKNLQKTFDSYHGNEIRRLKDLNPNEKEYIIQKEATKNTIKHMQDQGWIFNRIKFIRSDKEPIGPKDPFERPSFFGTGTLINIYKFWFKIYSTSDKFGVRLMFSGNDPIKVFGECKNYSDASYGPEADDFGDITITNHSVNNNNNNKENDLKDNGKVNKDNDDFVSDQNIKHVSENNSNDDNSNDVEKDDGKNGSDNEPSDPYGSVDDFDD